MICGFQLIVLDMLFFVIVFILVFGFDVWCLVCYYCCFVCIDFFPGGLIMYLVCFGVLGCYLICMWVRGVAVVLGFGLRFVLVSELVGWIGYFYV